MNTWKNVRTNKRNRTVILHGKRNTTPTANYRAADKIARTALPGARLAYTTTVNATPVRVYRVEV